MASQPCYRQGMTRLMRRAVVAVLVCGSLTVAGCSAVGESEEPGPSATSVMPTRVDRDAPRPDAVEGPGSRAEPLPLGATIVADGFSLVIDDYNPDGDAIAEAAFNDAPPAGYRYSIVTYTVTSALTEDLYVSLIPVTLVTPDDDVIDDRTAVLNDEMSGTIAPGASMTGSRTFLVPKGTDVLISVSPGVPTDTAYYVAPSTLVGYTG